MSVLHFTRHSMLAQLAQKFALASNGDFSKRRMVIVSAEFGGKQSHETGPC